MVENLLPKSEIKDVRESPNTRNVVIKLLPNKEVKDGGENPQLQYSTYYCVLLKSRRQHFKILLLFAFILAISIHIPLLFVREWPPPPPYSEYALVARYIVHTSEWGSLSTISTHEPIVSYPFNNIFSVSDGTITNSTGVPYFYLSELELSVFDIHKDNRATLAMSEAARSLCRRKGFDPEDPRCAHVMLTGRMLKIKNGTEEEAIAKQALFTRHPEMKGWPPSHNWFFAKLNITHIYLLDYFGGAKVVPVQEYYDCNMERYNFISRQFRSTFLPR